MLDVQHPQINVDEIMQRIHEKVRLRRQQIPSNEEAGPVSPSDSTLILNQVIAQARDSAGAATDRNHMRKADLRVGKARMYVLLEL